MHLIRPLAILPLALLWLACPLAAQGRTCRIVYPDRPAGAPKSAYLFDGTKSQAVTLPSMNLSEVIELPKGELTLAMTLNEIMDPETIPAGAPMLKIPEDVKDFYIIILPDPQNPSLPVKMNLVNAAEGNFKPGDTLWFNFTEHRIAARLGKAEITLDPMARSISRDPAPTSGYYAAQFAFQSQGAGEFAPITEQSWWHDAGSRHIGFVVNTGGRLPKIFFFRDFRDPNAQAVLNDESVEP